VVEPNGVEHLEARHVGQRQVEHGRPRGSGGSRPRADAERRN
jgi:hypothetical protein